MTSVNTIIYEFKSLVNKIHDYVMMNKQNKQNSHFFRTLTHRRRGNHRGGGRVGVVGVGVGVGVVGIGDRGPAVTVEQGAWSRCFDTRP